MEKEYSFEDYANFQFKDAKLPIKNSLEIIRNVGVSSGDYASVIEIGNNRVAKVNRILRIDNGAVKLQGLETDKYLAEKGKDPEQTRNNAVEKMMLLAKDKRETYELLGQYIGPFLPKIEMFAIVESPRKELEKVMSKNNVSADLSTIPGSEIALMEIWEKVNPRNAFNHFKYEKLDRMFHNTEFIQQSKQFAEASLRLLEEKRIFLDISDRGGVRGINKNGEKVNLISYADLENSEQDSTIVYPRNTVFDEGKLKFFDMFPVHSVDATVTDEMIKTIKKHLSTNDFTGLQELENTCENPKDFQLTTQYLYLLKKLGAEL